MSREEENIGRNVRKDKLKENGVPLTEEQYALYILTQRALIGFLSQRIAFIDPKRSKMDCECQAATIISKTYHDWFHEQVNVMVLERFVNLYNGMHGPRNLFQALFPEVEIDDFLRSHLQMPMAECLEEDALNAMTNAKIEKVMDNSRGQENQMPAP